MPVFDRNPWKAHLRQERIQRNWRQKDLAEQLGTSVVTVQRWERGSQQPSAYFRLKLCAIYGKSAEDLGFTDSLSAEGDLIGEKVAQEKYLPFCQRILRIIEQQLQPLFSDHAYPSSGSANSYLEQEDPAEAPSGCSQLNRNLTLESHNSSTAETLYGFAVLCEAQGGLQEAASLYWQALQIHEQVSGPSHPKTTAIRESLHAILHTLGQTSAKSTEF